MKETGKSCLGKFYGIGVGPGTQGMISIAAWEALQQAEVIFAPRAKHVEKSVAEQCLNGLNISSAKIKELIYNMDSDRTLLDGHYAKLAEELATYLRAGKTVAYLTIGDSLTYSTYGYLIKALLKIVPDLKHVTFPGITSYSAIASAFDWPLGQGKERMLILPCPDDMEMLRLDIETHDVVVLMKIGKRLLDVLNLLTQMKIRDYCVFASRIGLPGQILCKDLQQLKITDSLGYLSTMLIRKRSLDQEFALNKASEPMEVAV
jgi:precorrin-2/cobalt-factor-2 C20-methyltransferase